MEKSNSQDHVTKEEAHTPLLNHLIEARKRLIFTLLSIIIIFLALYPFANQLYHFLALPLMQHLPRGSRIIATAVATPFLTPLKLTLILSALIAIPFILYQLWSFIAPGLYRKEKHVAWPLLIASTALFYIGIAFAYWVVFPLVFGFFTTVGPNNITVMPDMGLYLNFCLKLFFAFGLAFEVPILTLLLIKSGIVSAKQLSTKRPYIIVVAFIIGMLLTPPDIISQVLLALPIWLLYEIGILLSRIGRNNERIYP